MWSSSLFWPASRVRSPLAVAVLLLVPPLLPHTQQEMDQDNVKARGMFNLVCGTSSYPSRLFGSFALQGTGGEGRCSLTLSLAAYLKSVLWTYRRLFLTLLGGIPDRRRRQL